MFIVKTESIKLPEGVVLKKEAMEIFNLFKCHAFIAEKSKGDITKCLCLLPFDDVEFKDVFEEGMYTYESTNPYADEMIELLEELSANARPILFDESDIFATI